MQVLLRVITCYNEAGNSLRGEDMGAVKLTKIGNSQGVTLPKEILEQGDFSLGDSLEVYVHNGRIIIFKKPPHHSEMVFEGAQDESDLEWADADMGEWEKEK